MIHQKIIFPMFLALFFLAHASAQSSFTFEDNSAGV